MKLAIVSDTHLPQSSRRLPGACVERLRAADLVLHAGDLATLDVLHALEALGPPVRAVHGNVDDPGVTEHLPAETVVDAAGARIALLHDSGPASGRLARLRARFPSVDAVVFGHSHIPLHETAPDGFQIFNPGSPTERRRQPRHTMGEGRVRDGRLALAVVALD